MLPLVGEPKASTLSNSVRALLLREQGFAMSSLWRFIRML